VGGCQRAEEALGPVKRRSDKRPFPSGCLARRKKKRKRRGHSWGGAEKKGQLDRVPSAKPKKKAALPPRSLLENRIMGGAVVLSDRRVHSSTGVVTISRNGEDGEGEDLLVFKRAKKGSQKRTQRSRKMEGGLPASPLTLNMPEEQIVGRGRGHVHPHSP